MTHLTNTAYDQCIDIELTNGDVLFLDGSVFGEIAAVTNAGLVRYTVPGDGEEVRCEIGKAALHRKIEEADEVTIR